MSVPVKDPSQIEVYVGPGGRLVLGGVKFFQEFARAIRQLQAGTFGSGANEAASATFNARALFGYDGADAVVQGAISKGIRFLVNSASFGDAGAEAMRIDENENVLIGTTTAGASKLVVADDSVQINTAKTPATAADTGTTGQVAWDSSYVYVCVATDTWKRAAISTW